MKILSAQQLHQADQASLKRQNISSLELMERAATSTYKKIKKKLSKKQILQIFCGIGNNGGDGLVLARKFAESDYQIEVLIVNYNQKRSPDFIANLKRLEGFNKIKILELNEFNKHPEIRKNAVIIDAIFDIGLNRSLPDWMNDLIAYLNDSENFKIAIDVPSGMFVDKPMIANQRIFKADLTCTFQCPKLAFFLPETYPFVGELKVINIGLDQFFIKALQKTAIYIQKADVKRYYKPAKRFSHKGTFGHCLVVGGSFGKMGSVVLAVRAALRMGAGKVTSFIPKSGYNILQISISEAMVITSETSDILSDFIPPKFMPNTICFGMGAGTASKTLTFFRALLSWAKKPMVIDADGLNILSKHKKLLDLVPENSVLTPHPKELERLIGGWRNSFEKLEKARDFAQKYQLTLVLKDAITIIISGDETHVNSTGNAGMATAGSGDVLSGIIAGLMSRGYPPKEAAILGVFIHGKSGDLAVDKSSQETLIAGDIIRNFANAFKAINS